MKHKLTPEQEAIIATDFDIKVNAVAGSGKTTTIVEYAKTRPAGSKILYLVFNKSAKVDAEAKFIKEKVYNVKVQTAHSLAYAKIMTLPIYKLDHKGYNSHDTMVVMNLTGEDRYMLANHVNKFVSAYCNDDEKDILDIDYLQCISHEQETIKFVVGNLSKIRQLAVMFWDKMDNAEIDVTHEFYLKKYQLSEPILNYDYILFDEGQDSSPVMLDVFMRQKAIKVIVGDTHQQIYSWRGAVNSLELVNFPHYTLSKSFRFGTELAKLAMSILKRKNQYVDIQGGGAYHNLTIYTEAIISRTNVCLLEAMVNYIRNNPDDYIYFEGNVNSLIYTESGVSVYDVINLFTGNIKSIKNKFIKTFSGFKMLSNYCTKADDRELGTMCTLAEKYGRNLGDVLNDIKEKCVDDKDDAEMSFSTTHKAKGLEYDKVTLTRDFATEEMIEGVCSDEELNVLYVAATRAKKELVLPMELDHFWEEAIYYEG